MLDHPNVRQLNETTEKMLSDIRVFVLERFKPLAAAMDAEERLYGAITVIFLLNKDLYGEIHYIDYSEGLTEKLQAALTEDDVRYLHLKILEGIPGFGN